MGGGVALLWRQTPVEALFIAAAMVATSFVITAEVLSSLGSPHAVASRTILAAAFVDDVLGLIVLALVTSYARGQMNCIDPTLTALIAVGFTEFAAIRGHRAASHFVPDLRGMRLAEAEFTLAMTRLFGLSLLAVYAGLAAIIGAFLAGMALSETVDERVHTMTSGVAELMVPFFLAGIGLRLDPAVFTNRHTLIFALVLLVTAIVSKFLGCGLGAMRSGFRDALRVGAGMAPRGEVGMVVAALGRKMGVMSESVYAIVVFLSIATTLAAPPLIRLAFRGVEPSVEGDRKILTTPG